MGEWHRGHVAAEEEDHTSGLLIFQAVSIISGNSAKYTSKCLVPHRHLFSVNLL